MLPGRLGQQYARHVRTHVTGNARQHISVTARMYIDIKVPGRHAHGTVTGQGEGRLTQLPGIVAEHQVLHDRVTDHAQFHNVMDVDTGSFG